MSRPVYLEFEEEVVSALQKIKKAGADDLILVIPQGARVLKNLTSLKLLKQQADRLNKVICIATADKRGKMLAGRAEISVLSDAKSIVKPHNAKNPAASIDVAKPAPERASHKHMPSMPAAALHSSHEKTKRSDDEELSTLIGPAAQSSEKIRLPAKERKTANLPYILLPVIAALAVIAVFAFLVLPSAQITVHARAEQVNREMEILVDSAQADADSQNRMVPGQKVVEELADSKTFAPTGKKNVGDKASGFVTLYNFSQNTLALKSKTTRLQVDGKIYNFLQDVGSIRPTRMLSDGTTPDPASLINPVPVVAAAGGEASNLPSSTRFEVHNEVFGYQPDQLYAINANPIAGGANKEIPVIAEADADTSRQELQSSILEKLKTLVGEKLSTDHVLAEGSYKIEILEESFSHPVGSEVENFQLTQRARITALVFDEKLLKQVMEDRITSLLPENKFLDAKSEQQLTMRFASLDLATGTGTVLASLQASLKYRLNEEFLSRGLLGKTATQVKEILLARPEIDRVDVNLSPFWVKKVPYFKSKMEFKVVE